MTKPDPIVQAAEDMFAAWQVLAFRLPMLAMQPTPSRQREAQRMVTEKAEAAFDGALAWQRYWALTSLKLWSKPLAPNALQEAADAWAAPGRKTLRANAKRLSRRQRR